MKEHILGCRCLHFDAKKIGYLMKTKHPISRRIFYA